MAKVFAYKGNIIGGGIGEDIKVTQTGSVSTNADYEILLSKSANDTTETDTVNKASGLTYNPSTNQLKINGTAVLTQHQDISGKVNKSGDTMTGNLLLKQSGIDASKTNNNVSTIQYPTTFCVLDTASRILARQEGVIDSSGNIGSYWYVRNYDTSAVQVAQKGLKMTMDKRGALTWTVDDSANFRSAISCPAMTSDSYPTLLPTNGSNGWIKIGTANTSYGIIPSQSGAAGSGHNNIGTSSWYWANAYIDNVYGKLHGNCTGSAGSVAWGNVTGKPSTYSPSSHTHPVSQLTWGGGVNLSCTASANNQEWSVDLNAGSYAGCYWHVWSGQTSSSILKCYPADNSVTVSGTLRLTKNTDVGTTNSPDNAALVIGGADNAQHIEIDSNEIIAKAGTGTPNKLWLQDNAGDLGIAGKNYSVNNASGFRSAIGAAASSSRLTKFNIEDMTYEEAKKIFDVNVVSFDYKEGFVNPTDIKDRYYGVIAEDIKDEIPYVVNIPKDFKEEDFVEEKGLEQPLVLVDYVNFIPYLLKVVQNQEQRIKELESKM